MASEPELKGLQRLREICQKNDLPVDCLSPKEPSVVAGEHFLGQPFDPLLAALYSQTDGAMLGDLQIYPFREPENVVLRINRGMRRFGEEPYLSSLLFGQMPLLAYYLATVPQLADASNLQPVIFINGYEGDQVLPVASNVDEFLMLFSLYLERSVATSEFTSERRIMPRFPKSVLDIVARDRPLVAALSAGRFASLTHTEESRAWVAGVIGTAQSS